MNTLLLTGNDTDVGKTWVVGSLARILASHGASVQIIKPVECGVASGAQGDAATACTFATEANPGGNITAHTFYSLPEPLAPRSATGGDQITLAALVTQIESLPTVDWRIIEGAGGVSVPIEGDGCDWADVALAVQVDWVIGVVEDRLGAINQSRLLSAYLQQRGLRFALWLNECQPQEAAVRASNLAALRELQLPLCAAQRYAQAVPEVVRAVWQERETTGTQEPPDLFAEWRTAVNKRAQQHLERTLTVRTRDALQQCLNLADNDYLRLSQHARVVAAAQRATREWGTSASASPLITGYTSLHAALEERLQVWHGFAAGLIWNSGYAANQAVLSQLPTRGDLILADRWIHNSMVNGILRSGAQLLRYRHCDLDHLQVLLQKYAGSGRKVFVVTESVFSMDGDYPDLAAMAELKQQYGFFWIVDEAHALGWYGDRGSGLVEQYDCAGAVDVLVGTLGKGLGSMGAYTLFNDQVLRRYFINFASEFIYSTYLPPAAVGAALEAVEVCQQYGRERLTWQRQAVAFRAQLQADNWAVATGDSPIVPILMDSAEQAMAVAAGLWQQGMKVCAIRPPTVPHSRLRLSLNAGLSDNDYTRLRMCLRTLADAIRTGCIQPD